MSHVLGSPFMWGDILETCGTLMFQTRLEDIKWFHSLTQTGTAEGKNHSKNGWGEKANYHWRDSSRVLHPGLFDR